jgi:aryl-alcohol dehydrogenase-like predicted oxidoreductase
MRFVEVDGKRLSAIGLGTWQFGSNEWGYGSEYANGVAGRLVERALDLGVNVIDTAEVYGRGNSERLVGQGIRGRRAEAFVATKIFPTTPTAAYIESRGRKSAYRLGIDVIDLYQIHKPNPIVPIGQQMEGMRRLQKAGIVTDVGVSSFSLARWRAAEQALGSPVLSNQVQYSLVARAPDAELVPYAQANDRMIMAYSPLGMGLLSGRYTSANPPKGSVRLNHPLYLPENLDRVQPLIEAVRSVADAHDATPAQVALAWVISHPNVIAIPGASSIEQLEANVAAADLELSADEIAGLTRASDAFTPPSGLGEWAKVAKRRLKRRSPAAV